MVLATGAAWLLLLAAPLQALDAAEVVADLGFSSEERGRVRAGEIVSHALEEREDELAVVIALIVKAPLQRVFDFARRGDVLDADRALLSHRIVPEGQANAASLADLTLPGSELEKLAKAKPGSSFNLSSAELESISVASSGGSDAVVTAYRAALAARIESYRQHGLDGIAPYDRGSGDSSDPAEKLRHALGQMKALEKRAPELYLGLARYPRAGAHELESEIRWVVEEAQDRPTAVLTHRFFSHGGDFALGGQRQFYVGQSYDALQIVVALFSVEGGTLVIYSNRTYTDQVAGFGSGARHRIGRGILVKTVTEMLASVRSQLGGG
jgi:hypothetical protein